MIQHCIISVNNSRETRWHLGKHFNQVPDADNKFQLIQRRLEENSPRVKMLQQIEQSSTYFQESYFNNYAVQGADDMQPSPKRRQQSSKTFMDGSEAAAASQHWEELPYFVKEAMEPFHVHKEWAAASLPKDPPVISSGDAQGCLPSLGSPDHIKRGFKSVSHKQEGPAAVLL